jgi:hypothetical protein
MGVLYRQVLNTREATVMHVAFIKQISKCTDNECEVMTVIRVKIIEQASEFKYLEYVFSDERRGMEIKSKFYNKINYF